MPSPVPTLRSPPRLISPFETSQQMSSALAGCRILLHGRELLPLWRPAIDLPQSSGPRPRCRSEDEHQNKVNTSFTSEWVRRCRYDLSSMLFCGDMEMGSSKEMYTRMASRSFNALLCYFVFFRLWYTNLEEMSRHLTNASDPKCQILCVKHVIT